MKAPKDAAELERLRAENLALAAQVARMREALQQIATSKCFGTYGPCGQADSHVWWAEAALEESPTATERYVEAAIELASFVCGCDLHEAPPSQLGKYYDMRDAYREAKAAMEDK